MFSESKLKMRPETVNEVNSLISGVFSVGGKVSRMVIRNTVMERRAEMPRVTFSPDSEGT